jgi:uncharacterized coiled-coil DUF342 family protein
MDMEEYRNRIDKAHTVTGVPTYWEQLQEVTKERDSLLLQIAELRAEVQRLSQIARY